MLLGAPGIATRSKDATGSKGTRFFAHSVPSLSAQAVSVVSFSSLLPPNSGLQPSLGTIFRVDSESSLGLGLPNNEVKERGETEGETRSQNVIKCTRSKEATSNKGHSY